VGRELRRKFLMCRREGGKEGRNEEGIFMPSREGLAYF
jgi:hypothetical protein